MTEQSSSGSKLSEVIDEIKIFRIPNLKNNRLKKVQIWKWLFNNYKLIKNADIIHCHDVFFWYLPFRFLFPSKKVFTTFHGHEDYPLRQKNILIRKMSEKLSNGNICIGDFIKKWYGTNPNYVSYGAVRATNSSIISPDRIKKESAIFFGRLDEQTGILTYLKAFKQIKKQIPDFKLTIFGNGKFKKRIDKSIISKDFSKNIQKEIGKYNFVFVSRYLSILEAMAAKKLVFAVYEDPLKEDYLRMTPFSKYMIIFKSPSELVSKILFYLANPKAKEEMIEKAYTLVKNYTWEEMTKTYLKLWKI